MIVRFRTDDNTVVIEMSAENDQDRETLSAIDRTVVSSVRLGVDSTMGRPDGTVGALTLVERDDDPRE